LDAFIGHIDVSIGTGVRGIHCTTPVMFCICILFIARFLKINLWADLVAFFVHVLPVLVEAIVCATHFQKLITGGLVNQDVHITFDFLCGRPIDLAILFQAILILVREMVISDATCTALRVFHRTRIPFACVM